MFNLLGLAAAVFCVIAGGVSAQNTATFSYSATSTDCTAGTFTCTISAGVVDTIMGEANPKISFLKGGAEQFAITGTSGTSWTFVDGGGASVAGLTGSGGTGTTFTLTFSSTFPLTSAQAGAWTCTVASDATTSTAATAVTIANSDLGNCATTISMNACSKTVTCDLGQSVALVITAGGTINFKKASTIMYKIAATNTVTDNAATPAAVTGLTASAPAGTTAGGDANDATLTFGSTFVTFDSATLDGAWTCDVTGATGSWYALASDSTTLSTTCGAINNQVTGLFVAMLIAIKTLLF